MATTVKCTYCFLIIFTISVWAKVGQTDQFITKSSILKNTDIKIFVGENQEKAIVFHTSDFENIKDSELFILTSKGPYSLQGHLEKMDLLNECGDPISGLGFKKTGHDGFLVATGKDTDKIIKFYPARGKSPKDIKKSCLKEIPKEKYKAVEYASNGLNGDIQQIRWKRNLTKDEIEKECDSYADWNAKINNSYVYKDLYENCLNSGWSCKDEERIIVTLQDDNGNCQQITNSSIDCDGKAGIGMDLREFLGVLKIEYKSIKEVWLLWNAPGYEGDGIYAIEINDIPNSKRLHDEWLVYNGC